MQCQPRSCHSHKDDIYVKKKWDVTGGHAEQGGSGVRRRLQKQGWIWLPASYLPPAGLARGLSGRERAPPDPPCPHPSVAVAEGSRLRPTQQLSVGWVVLEPTRGQGSQGVISSREASAQVCRRGVPICLGGPKTAAIVERRDILVLGCWKSP